MPKNLTAAQYFGTADMNIRHNFAVDIMRLSFMQKDELKTLDSKFAGDHNRIFTLVKDDNGQWKRVSLVEKYGTDIFQTHNLANKRQDVLYEMYDMVEQGNLFFYNRGSDVPMQYKFRETPHGHRISLEAIPEDPRFADIHAQRKDEAKQELEQYRQYQEGLAREETLHAFRRDDVLVKVETGRQRAHDILSPTKPRALYFENDGDFLAKPIELEGGSRFTPDEMETIVLAACCTDQAVTANPKADYNGLTGEERLYQMLAPNMYEDVMISGRTGSNVTVLHTYEKGREVAADLIQQEMNGDSSTLKQVMMNALRAHIQASRDQPSLAPALLLMYEQTEKMAKLMATHQLFENDEEFHAMRQEAEAMGKVARICFDGAKAKRELMDAYQKGKFQSEEQRLDIASRIQAYRYVLAQHYHGQHQREQSAEFQAVGIQLAELASQVGTTLTKEQQMMMDGQIMAQRAKDAPMRPQIREIIDGTKQGFVMDTRLRNYGLLTAEGQQLMKAKNPYDMIAAVAKQPALDAKVSGNLMTEMQEKMATRMDTTAATNFWNSMLRAMGPGQFDPSLVTGEFRRLVVQRSSDKVNVDLVAALGYRREDMNVRTMADAEMMEKIRDQIAQGNVFFFKRGESIPYRLSLDENGMAALSEKPVQATHPGLLAQFLHFISGGRLYREAFERYNQERVFRGGGETVVANVVRASNEIANYEEALAEKAIEKTISGFDTTASAFQDMAQARSRAHNVLSLDAPATVPFENTTPSYTGQKHEIPDAVKSKFTAEELDALCLAGITSAEAAKAHMEAGISKVKGTTAESTADALEGHIYHDLLVAGRDGSDVFFPLLNAGRQVAANAAKAYAVGEPDQMAKLLGDAIRATVLSGRYDTGVKSNSALASDMALRMVGMLEKDPQLKEKCGIDDETLEGYKQELTGLRLIGEAYERAGNAHRKLAAIVAEDRDLTQEEGMEIAIDILTYRYLNALQVQECVKAGQKPEIERLGLLQTLRVMKKNAEGKLMHPLDEDFGPGPVRDYHLSKDELRDVSFDIKKLYKDPLVPVKTLAATTLDQIHGHIILTEQFDLLCEATDPLEFIRTLAAQDSKDNIQNLVNTVSHTRKQELIKQLQAQNKLLQEQVNKEIGLDKSVAPDKQPENPQLKPPAMC